MAVTSLADIEDILRRADLVRLPAIPIAILRNVVVEPIEPYLRFLAYEMGHDARVQFGAYDQVFQEAVGGRADLLNDATACVAVFASLDVLSWSLARNFAALGRADVDQEAERIDQWTRRVLAGIRHQTPALILWHGFESPLYPALGIADGQRPDGQAAVIAALNDRLRTALAETASAYCVDMNTCRARLGDAAFYDRRYWHIGRAPYSREAVQEIAREDFKYLRALKGKQKKCLVLDCDEVLWGGIVGEDGVAGIKLGRSYPGSPYFELQQEIVNLHHRGVLVALASKNNEADVWEVFRTHPDMVLREDHISAFRINWSDKATNIREMSAELNIGLDSLVFADDSEVECEFVRRELPEVEVVHLPRNRAVEHAHRLAAGGWFDVPTLSEEDRRRGSAYKAEAVRQQLRREAPDLEGYFRSLDMVLQVRSADRLSMPRIAQLTQKTNQFNLTTRRYSEEEIARVAADASAEVLSLRLTDRFGDAGLVGVAILRFDGARAIVDTFLLSCRVLGRGVEDAFIACCLRRAQARGSEVAVGLFVPTARNQLASGFYERRGFRSGGEADGTRWELGLEGLSITAPSYFKQIDDVDGPAGTEE